MTAYFDRVKETTTTTGTGNIALAGAVPGFQSFSSAFDLNLSFYYGLEAVDSNGVPTGAWEVGQGYLSGATTLVRDIVFASSNAGALVSLAAGTKNIWCDWPAQNAQIAKIGFDLQYGMP